MQQVFVECLLYTLSREEESPLSQEEHSLVGRGWTEVMMGMARARTHPRLEARSLPGSTRWALGWQTGQSSQVERTWESVPGRKKKSSHVQRGGNQVDFPAWGFLRRPFRMRVGCSVLS